MKAIVVDDNPTSRLVLRKIIAGDLGVDVLEIPRMVETFGSHGGDV